MGVLPVPALIRMMLGRKPAWGPRLPTPPPPRNPPSKGRAPESDLRVPRPPPQQNPVLLVPTSEGALRMRVALVPGSRWRLRWRRLRLVVLVLTSGGALLVLVVLIPGSDRSDLGRVRLVHRPRPLPTVSRAMRLPLPLLSSDQVLLAPPTKGPRLSLVLKAGRRLLMFPVRGPRPAGRVEDSGVGAPNPELQRRMKGRSRTRRSYEGAPDLRWDGSRATLIPSGSPGPCRSG